MFKHVIFSTLIIKRLKVSGDVSGRGRMSSIEEPLTPVLGRLGGDCDVKIKVLPNLWSCHQAAGERMNHTYDSPLMKHANVGQIKRAEEDSGLYIVKYTEYIEAIRGCSEGLIAKVVILQCEEWALTRFLWACWRLCCFTWRCTDTSLHTGAWRAAPGCRWSSALNTGCAAPSWSSAAVRGTPLGPRGAEEEERLRKLLPLQSYVTSQGFISARTWRSSSFLFTISS